MSNSGNSHIRKHTLIYCSAVCMCVPGREWAHPLRALVTRACVLDERSAWGSEPGALLKCKAKQSTLLYISEAFPTDFAVFEAFLGQGYSLVYSVHLEKKENSARGRERRKTQAIFCSLDTVKCNSLWRLNRRPCTTALTARCLDRNTLVKQEKK